MSYICFFGFQCPVFFVEVSLFLSPGSDSSGRPPLKPQPATLQSSKAKFHPQLWQCFIDQTWPDKVGPVGVGRCQGAKVLVPYGWCGWSKHFLGGGVVSNSCFIFTSIWGRFPFWLRFFRLGHQLGRNCSSQKLEKWSKKTNVWKEPRLKTLTPCRCYITVFFFFFFLCFHGWEQKRQLPIILLIIQVMPHQIWEPVWIMWKVTVKGLWIMKPTELSLKRP